MAKQNYDERAYHRVTQLSDAYGFTVDSPIDDDIIEGGGWGEVCYEDIQDMIFVWKPERLPDECDPYRATEENENQNHGHTTWRSALEATYNYVFLIRCQEHKYDLTKAQELWGYLKASLKSKIPEMEDVDFVMMIDLLDDGRPEVSKRSNRKRKP